MPPLLSADEYLATGSTRSRWTELIDGEVRLLNSPAVRHQMVVSYIHFTLMTWIEQGADLGLSRGVSPGTIDIRINERTVVAPDVLWFSNGRFSSSPAFSSVVPELVVEVRSRSTWKHDTTEKFAIYQDVGVGELWLVDTLANQIAVHSRSEPSATIFDRTVTLHDGLLRSPFLEGYALNVLKVFDR
jgi:Uma2 family endonuclease